MGERFWRVPLPPESIRFVDSIEQEDFQCLLAALQRSRIIGLDAEWKPVVSSASQLRVSLLQIACRFNDCGSEGDLVFVLDVLTIPPSALLEPLKEALTSSRILKLGFKLRQDLINLAASLSAPKDFFSAVKPYIDIGNLHRLALTTRRNEFVGQTPSLAHICGEVLGLPLCKDMQCSDWELRPLTKEQITYAAADAHCLLAILDALRDDLIQLQRLKTEGCVGIARLLYPEKEAASLITRLGLIRQRTESETAGYSIYLGSYEEALSLQARPADSRKKHHKDKTNFRKNSSEFLDWHGPPPWDPAVGGDGCPKFLCDIMIEGLARQLRCVGIDAACPHGLKPDARQLIERTQREGRVLLTRDAKLLRQRLIPSNQAYRVKHLNKKDQLTEIIQTFNLTIQEEQLLSRCTKCNGDLFPESMTAQEAKVAAPDQEISDELMLQEGLLFWQCSECRHLYWQGLQFKRAMKQFATMCN